MSSLTSPSKPSQGHARRISLTVDASSPTASSPRMAFLSPTRLIGPSNMFKQRAPTEPSSPRLKAAGIDSPSSEVPVRKWLRPISGNHLGQKSTGGALHRLTSWMWVTSDSTSPSRYELVGPSTSSPSSSPRSSPPPIPARGPQRALYLLSHRTGLSPLFLGLLLFLALINIASDFLPSSSAPHPIRVSGREPYTVLRELSLLDTEPRTPRPGHEPDVTAVVLNWKRLDNVVLIVAQLCSAGLADVVHTIVVHNNNPSFSLTSSDFVTSHCPEDRLRIVNAKNDCFLGRYLSCRESKTPFCYVQDDDYLLPTPVIRAMRAQLNHDPDSTPVVATDAEGAVRESWEWCFNNFDHTPPLHTCMSWLGTGALFSRALATSFLTFFTSPTLALPSTSLDMADNYFTLLSNTPPRAVLSAPVLGLPHTDAFTVGTTGDDRNDRHMLDALELLRTYIRSGAETHSYPSLAQDVALDRTVRAVGRGGEVLISNVGWLPEPLEGREQWDGQSVRAWVESRRTELGPGLRDWVVEHGFGRALEEDAATAWKSVDVAKRGDYVGLDLRALPLPVPDASTSPTLNILFPSPSMLAHSTLQHSRDGINWQDHLSSAAQCTSTAHHLHAPKYAFPDPRRGKAKWRRRLSRCSWVIGRGADWAFVRVKLDSVVHDGQGWVVHRIWVE